MNPSQLNMILLCSTCGWLQSSSEFWIGRGLYFRFISRTWCVLWFASTKWYRIKCRVTQPVHAGASQVWAPKYRVRRGVSLIWVPKCMVWHSSEGLHRFEFLWTRIVAPMNRGDDLWGPTHHCVLTLCKEFESFWVLMDNSWCPPPTHGSFTLGK
jgi:hypothetical protein